MNEQQLNTGGSISPNFPPLTPTQLVQLGRIESETAPAEQIATAQPVQHPVNPISVNKVSAAPISAPNPYLPTAASAKVAPPIAAAAPVPPTIPVAPIVSAAPVTPAAPVIPVAPVIPAATVAPATPVMPVIPISPVTPAASTPVKTAYEPVLAEAEEPITSQLSLFTPNSNLTAEPQTASIIIDTVDPLQNLSIAISETGELLKTGSIELPNYTSTNTGEIATILDAAEVDEAIAQDSISGYVSTIAPMRASGVVNTSGKIGIMPSRAAKGQGQVFALVSVSILMVTIGGLVIAAFMLGFLK